MCWPPWNGTTCTPSIVVEGSCFSAVGVNGAIAAVRASFCAGRRSRRAGEQATTTVIAAISPHGKLAW